MQGRDRGVSVDLTGWNYRIGNTGLEIRAATTRSPPSRTAPSAFVATPGRLRWRRHVVLRQRRHACGVPNFAPHPRGGIREGGFRVVQARISNPVIPTRRSIDPAGNAACFILPSPKTRWRRRGCVDTTGDTTTDCAASGRRRSGGIPCGRGSWAAGAAANRAAATATTSAARAAATAPTTPLHAGEATARSTAAGGEDTGRTTGTAPTRSPTA